MLMCACELGHSSDVCVHGADVVSHVSWKTCGKHMKCPGYGRTCHGKLCYTTYFKLVWAMFSL